MTGGPAWRGDRLAASAAGEAAPGGGVGKGVERRRRAKDHQRRPAGGWLATLPPILLLVLSACGRWDGDDAGESDRLLVLAASSLDRAMPELISAFEARSGTTSDLVLGATGTLAAQIANGAPADVIFTADDRTIGRLAAAALIEADTRAVYAVGRLAIVVADRHEVAAELAELAEPRFAVIAIANPEHAPYGEAAAEALRQAGVWPAVAPRLVYAENVAQTLQFVRSGNADAAIVAASVAASVPTSRRALVDQGLHAPIRHELAVVAGRRHPHAKALARFVMGAEGQAILALHGFGPPSAE